MFTHFHHHHLEKLFHLKSRLGLLYWHLIIQAFAVSLVSIFVPVYLLIIGFTLSGVFFYLLVEWTVFGLFAPFYGKIIHNTGLKEIIIIRTPLYALALLLLSLLEHSPPLQEYYYLIGALSGCAGGLYTLSITSLFAKYIGEKKQSEKTGAFFGLPKLTSLLAPVVGGAIAVYFGFGTLFMFVVVLLFISLVPLSFVKKNIDHPPFRFTVFRQFAFDVKEFIFLNAYGIKTLVTYIIVPIAIYLFAQNILALGVIVSVLSLMSALVTISVGILSDKFKKAQLIKLGSLGSAFLFLILGYFLNAEILLYLFLIAGIVGVFVDIPYETHLYKQARKKSPLEFLAFKELSLFVGRFIFLVVILLIGARMDVAFYLGAVASGAFWFF